MRWLSARHVAVLLQSPSYQPKCALPGAHRIFGAHLIWCQEGSGCTVGGGGDDASFLDIPAQLQSLADTCSRGSCRDPQLGAACEVGAACAGNVVQSLSFSSIVPLTIWAFTFDWPLLDPAPSLGSNFLLGTGGPHRALPSQAACPPSAATLIAAVVLCLVGVPTTPVWSTT